MSDGTEAKYPRNRWHDLYAKYGVDKDAGRDVEGVAETEPCAACGVESTELNVFGVCPGCDGRPPTKTVDLSKVREATQDVVVSSTNVSVWASFPEVASEAVSVDEVRLEVEDVN